MEIFKIVTLSLSGLLLLFVGSMRLFNPIKTYLKNSGITLAKDVDLLNEIRGLSGVMLFGGILLLLGIFISSLSITSFIVGILLFIGFAVGRVLGMLTDGKPNKKIIQGFIFELVFGTLNSACLILSLI